MADTMAFRWRNRVALALIHLWGNMKLYDFLVRCNRKADLVAMNAKQIWNRVKSNASSK